MFQVTAMDPAINGSIKDDDQEEVCENEMLKKKLHETEEKLNKFKSFVIKLRDERNQLQSQVNRRFGAWTL